MPGLYGLLGFGDPRQVSCILDEMIATAEGPSSPGTRIGYFGDLALGLVGRPSCPGGSSHIFTDHGTTLALCGRLYEEGLTLPGGAPDREALLARFRAGGVVALAGLDGEYVMAVWEARPRRLTLLNDRVGSQPLYCWTAGRRTAFAPTLCSLTRLHEFPTSLDEFSLGDLLTVGQHLNGRTWYSAARSLEPASILSFTESGVTSRTPDDAPSTGRDTSRDVSDAAFAEALEEAVRRRTKWQEEPFGLLLGGEESATALRRAVDEVGIRPIATFPRQGRCACGASGALEAPSQPAPWISLLSDETAEVLAPSPLSHRVRASTPETGPIFHSHQLRQLLRPEVYRAIHGVTTDTIERAYRDAPGDSSAARILALALRYRSYRGNVVPSLTAGHRGETILPHGAPALLELARRRCEVLPAPEPKAPSILGALSGAQHECRADNAPRLAVLIERSEERLERFFRMSALRELARYGAAGTPSMRPKMCTLVGIAVSLEREPALLPGGDDQLRGHAMLGVDFAAGRRGS